MITGMDMESSLFSAELLKIKQAAADVLELALTRPKGFSFYPGQYITVVYGGLKRDYTLISGPDDPELSILVKRIDGGAFSTILKTWAPGITVHVNGPYGYFTCRETELPILVMATGTGIAPFISMMKSGMKPVYCLYGVSLLKDAVFVSFLKDHSHTFTLCLSRESTQDTETVFFKGHVTDYLKTHVKKAAYDVYLCGNSAMIREATHIIDGLFPDSRIYSEAFF